MKSIATENESVPVTWCFPWIMIAVISAASIYRLVVWILQYSLSLLIFLYRIRRMRSHIWNGKRFACGLSKPALSRNWSKVWRPTTGSWKAHTLMFSWPRIGRLQPDSRFCRCYLTGIDNFKRTMTYQKSSLCSTKSKHTSLFS